VLPCRADVVAEFGLFCEAGCQQELDGGELRCRCDRCQAWADFVAGRGAPARLGPPRPQYEVLTREFADALAGYLRSRLRPGDLLLEVGAGDGRLGRALRARLPAELRVAVTDSGARGLDAAGLVERRDAAEAVAALRPAVVLCSWMPLGRDWTAAFRGAPGLREYVLVGDPGICGAPWETWGHRPGGRKRGICNFHCSSCGAPGRHGRVLPPAGQRCRAVRRLSANSLPRDLAAGGRAAAGSPRADGWTAAPLPEVSRHQLGRTDERWSCASRSVAVSFRRGPPAAPAAAPPQPAAKRARACGARPQDPPPDGAAGAAPAGVAAGAGPGRGLWPDSDVAYFGKYDSAFVHEEMLRDGARCAAYAAAIRAPGSLVRGGVVIDVGAGSGLLSCMCARAGARKVFAVEASAPSAALCRELVRANACEGIVEVVEGRLEDVELPAGTRADAIVSEWMGFFLLYESMLDSVLLARDRWLRPGGQMLPSRARLFLCPFCDDDWRGRRAELLRDVCGVDASALAPRLAQEEAAEPGIQGVEPGQLVGEPACVLELDLSTATAAAHCTRLAWTAPPGPGRAVHGFAGWFDVTFEPREWRPEAPAAELRAGAPLLPREELLAAPLASRFARAGETLFYLPPASPPLALLPGAQLSARVELRRPPENPRYLTGRPGAAAAGGAGAGHVAGRVLRRGA
ncbi:unnamed protein product, partial [Prorocentrum cordatum]